jgi:hypothetical protein
VTQWQDDFDSLEDRRTMARAMRDARMKRLELQQSAPEDVRHFGADGGLHHRTPHPDVSAVCGCGCQARPWSAGDDSADPIDVLGRQAGNDPLSAYERGRARADYERRSAELDAMRVRFTPVYGDD